MFAVRHPPEVLSESASLLLVEDSREEAMVTLRYLMEDGNDFQVHRVPTLKEALKWIAHHRIDVVLLDLGLPDSEGHNTIRELLHHFPDMPVIVVSGRTDAAAMLYALESGVQEFMLKDECSGKALRRAVLSAIFRKSLEKKPNS